MLNIVIFGAPGSGKGTQSELLVAKYGLDYISTGKALRDAINEGNDLGQIARKYIDRGQLVPDELTIQLISEFLDINRNSKGIIFDGFPRTIPQAIALKKILNERGIDISILLDLQVDDEELIQRLLERGKKSGRSDDHPETVQSRLDVYHTQTAPLSTYYISEGKYAPIKGTGTVEAIFQRIDEAIEAIMNYE
ncbi:MAG: adenylate kinase [Tannerella sp.]|jgi:adenylate kinase|nr:adenylate kinase [Tannerella sp.]